MSWIAERAAGLQALRRLAGRAGSPRAAHPGSRWPAGRCCSATWPGATRKRSWPGTVPARRPGRAMDSTATASLGGKSGAGRCEGGWVVLAQRVDLPLPRPDRRLVVRISTGTASARSQSPATCRWLCWSLRTKSASAFASARSDLAPRWHAGPVAEAGQRADRIHLTTGRQQRRHHQVH